MELFKLMGTIAVDNTKANQSIDETADKAKGAEGKLSGSFSKIGTAAATVGKGMVAVGAAGGALVGSIIGLSNSTMEYSENMGKLTVAYETHNYSAETAKGVYSDFVGILGDSDQATEAANHLAQLCTSEQELSEWTNIASGIYATFGDSLPLESLTEAANETARVGQVTGSFADAINWANTPLSAFRQSMGGNKDALAAFNQAIADGQTKEDAFTAALQACNTEQERSQLVTSTLNGLYGEAGAKYQELNGDLIAARQAQDEWNAAIGKAGEAVRPIATALMDLGTTVVEWAIPYLQQFAGWISANMPVIQQTISSAFDYVTNNVLPPLTQAFDFIRTTVLPPIQTAFQWFITNLPTLAPVITGIATAIMAFQGGIAIINGVKTAMTAWKTATTALKTATALLNTTLKANPIMLVVSLIAGLVAAFITAYNTSEEFRNTVNNAFNAVKNTISNVVNAVKGFVEGAWTTIKGAANNIKGAIDNAGKAFSDFRNKVSSAIDKAKSIVKSGLDKIKGFFSGLKLKLPDIKLPHFSISGGFSLNPLQVPKIGISWYKEGAIFDEPTIFPTAKGLKGVGEAGPEAVAPISDLQHYVGEEVESRLGGMAERFESMQDDISRLYRLMAYYMPKMLDASNKSLVLDTGALVGGTVAEFDRAMGERQRKKSRGQ